MFGFNGPWAGGVSQPGGSAANQTSIVVARNVLFPETKTEGNGGRRFVIFTSAHGHYSVEKAAQMFGFGSKAVRTVMVDETGRMQPAALEAAILKARDDGETPFYVNATAGTTVLGSFDPLDDLAEVCQKHKALAARGRLLGRSRHLQQKALLQAQRHRARGLDRAVSAQDDGRAVDCARFCSAGI